MRNRYDVFQWIIRCLESCTTHMHVLACNKLFRNFKNQYSLGHGDMFSLTIEYRTAETVQHYKIAQSNKKDNE